MLSENVGGGQAQGIINLANCEVDTTHDNALQLIRLSGESGGAENTIANPRNVYPADADVKAESPAKILFDVPAFSASIIKIRQIVKW